MSSSIDLNINNYDQNDLIALFNLENVDPVTYDDIINVSNPLIQKYTTEDNYDLANFYQEAQNKLLEDLDYDSDNDETNVQNNQSTQLGNLYQNQYPSQQNTDPNQANKTTDRKQQVNIYNENDNFVMNKNELGVNNTYDLPVAQGQLNPNLKNTITRTLCIDSKYRETIIPYNPNPDGPSSSTNFTMDLSEPIFNTLSISLTSFQIPYTWYLIDEVYQANNSFYIDNESLVSIESGNYTNDELIDEISGNTNFINNKLSITYSSKTGHTTITNNDTSEHTITFYDETGTLNYNNSCKVNSKFNNNLGWILGFRGNTDVPTSNANYSQMVYTIQPGEKITSQSIIDTFGSKYFLLVIDDFNQNHLNKGLIGITPTLKYADIPSYWNSALKISTAGCNTSSSGKTPTPSYVQNAPRKLTQAQLYTLNETTQARSNNTQHTVTAPTTTDVFAVIPLRNLNTYTLGQQYIDEFKFKDVERVYFGPVDLERMRVRLVDDKGYTVNLNGNDWSFTINAISLYQY